MEDSRSEKEEIRGLSGGMRVKSSVEIEDDEIGSPRRLPKPKSIICSQIWYWKMSKFEFELGDHGKSFPKVSGGPRREFWATLDPCLDRHSPPKAWKRPQIQFLSPLLGNLPLFLLLIHLSPCWGKVRVRSSCSMPCAISESV